MPSTFPPPFYTLGSTTLTINGITTTVAGLTLSGPTLANPSLTGTTGFPGGQGSGITTGGNLYLGGTNKLLLGNAAGDAPITHSNTLLPAAIGSGAALTDAKQLFYELGASNWAGEGVDSSGNYWRRTGLSGGGSYLVQYPNGGVYIGPSPTAPGAGNLLVSGSISSNYISTSNGAGAGNTELARLFHPSSTTGNQNYFLLGQSAAAGRSAAFGWLDNTDGTSGYAFIAAYGDTPPVGLTVNAGGNVGVGGHFSASGTIKTGVYTVATLPTAGTQGRRAYVSNALTPTFGAAVVGGGAVPSPVNDTGAAWNVG